MVTQSSFYDFFNKSFFNDNIIIKLKLLYIHIPTVHFIFGMACTVGIQQF